MAQQHLDRLSAVDAGFLHQESDATHMHIGAVAIFEGPAPAHAEFLAHIRARLPLVPRYRQKLAAPPLGLGRQRWIDDPTFNLEYHVRRSALPAPGDEERLRQIDRARVLPGAGPHEAAVGDVARRGSVRRAASRSCPRPTMRWSTGSPAST